MKTIVAIDNSGRVRLKEIQPLTSMGMETMWSSVKAPHFRTFSDPLATKADILKTSKFSLLARKHAASLPEFSSASITNFATPSGETIKALTDQIVIGFNQCDRDKVLSFITNNDLQELWFEPNGNFGLYLSLSTPLDELFENLKHDPVVLYAELNIIDGYDDFLVEFDTEDGTEDILVPDSLWNHEMLGLYTRDRLVKGDGVVIAVIDGLMSPDHPDLVNAYLVPPGSVSPIKGLPVIDHGMGVASVALGQKLLGNGHESGIAPKASLLPMEIDTSSGSSYADRARVVYSIADIATKQSLELSGLEPISIPRLIVNCSWKLRNYQDLTSIALAFKALTESPAICVCSSGNENSEQPHFPSDYPGVVSVAGIDELRKKFILSNYGEHVMFCAPAGTKVPLNGNDIYSATVNARHAYVMGTSFAAPHACGMLAIIWSHNPNFSNNEVLQYAIDNLCETIDDTNPEYFGKLGHGLLTLKNLP